MSALDDIKSGSEKVDMSKIVKPRHKTSPKTVITNDTPPRNRRESLNIEDIMPKEEEYQEDLKESIERDVLDLDNPESAFSKYLDEKMEMAAEYIAEKEEEKAVLNNKDPDNEEGGVDYVEDYDATPVTQNYSNIEIITEDISELKTKKEDPNNMPKELILGTVEEDTSNDLVIDATADEPAKELVFDTTVDDYDEDDLAEEEDYEADDELVAEESDEENEEALTDVVESEPTASEDDDEKERETKQSKEEKRPVVLGNPLNDQVTEEDIKAAQDAADLLTKKIVADQDNRVSAPELESDIEVTTSNEQFVKDIEVEDEADNIDVDEDEQLKQMQKLATERLKPVSKKLDISTFTILKKPVTNVNSILHEQKSRVAKWVLPAQESVVLMRTFSGSEIELLRQFSEDNRSVDALNRRYRMIYDHIMSPKPATFDAWLKSTPYEDVDHYFFAIYIANFKGANYLPLTCSNKNCKNSHLTEDLPIMNMVKFDDDKAKEKFTKLYESEGNIVGKGIYSTEVVPLSDKIAVSFKQPSIWNLIEIASIDSETRNKYSAILRYIPYIDTIYEIDAENMQLIPITYKMFPNDVSHTIKSKIQKYNNLFDTLTIDEFGPVKAYISALDEVKTGISYVYPAIECPKCHTISDEMDITAEELVFIRYQLGALVSTSLS